MSVNFEEQFKPKQSYYGNQSFLVRWLTKMHLTEEQAQKSLIFIFIGTIILIGVIYFLFLHTTDPATIPVPDNQKLIELE